MKKGILVMILLAAVPAPAWALDMEYYTYGGFSAIVLSFQKISLIFSDAGYNALIYVVVILGIFLGVVLVLMSAATGKKAYFLSWVPPILLGVGIYLALIVPKGSLTVYDPLKNRFQTVSGVPNGIVMVAGVLNKIEKGFVDIIDTSGNVQGFQRTGGGLGFNMLLIATQGGFGTGDTNIDASLRRYTKDCVMFELTRQGTSLTGDALAKTSTNAMTEFQQAASSAVWTVYYDGTNPAGTPMTCYDSFDMLKGFLSNDSNLTPVVTQECSAMGFDTKNPAELTRCFSDLSDFLSYLYDGAISVTPEGFIRQIAMMEVLDDIMRSGNIDLSIHVMTNKDVMSSGVTMGIVANDWLPVMRAVFTAVAVGLIPFIVLFIPTGYIGKACGLICGFFIWLTCWGITDAILHGIATDYIVLTVDYLKANNLGYNAIMLFPTFMLKALSMFGFVRTAGIMLATIMTNMLVSFGGHALAMMAGNIQGQLQSSASQHSSLVTGEGQARQIEAGRNIQGIWDNAGKYSYKEDAAARSALKMGQAGAGIDAMNQFGGKERFADAMADAGHSKFASEVGAGQGARKMGFDSVVRSSEVQTMTQAARAGQVSDAGAVRMGQNQGMDDQAKAFNNVEQLMVDTGMAGSLQEAYKMKNQLLAVGGKIGGLHDLYGIQGKQDALGGDASKMRGVASQDMGTKLGTQAQQRYEMAFTGMNAEQYGQWVAGGRVLNDTMANKLHEMGYAGAQAGMKANLAFDQDGKVAYMTGETEKGSYGAVYKGGKVLESSVENGFAVSTVRDANGNVIHTQGIKGRNMLSENSDMYVSKTGSDISRINRNVDIEEFGFRGEYGSRRVTYNVNDTQISAGTIYNGATMYGMATTGSGASTIANQIVNAAPGEMQEKEILTAASAYAKSVQEIASRKGFVLDGSSGKIGFGVSGVGGVDVNAASTDQRGVDLIATQFSNTAHKALREAKHSDFNSAQSQAHVAQAIQSFSRGIETEFSRATPADYGASAPGVAVFNGVRNVINTLGAKGSGGGVADSPDIDFGRR